MTTLLLSLLALAVGPVLVHFVHRLRAAAITLDAFVIVMVGGLVLTHVLPHAIENGRWFALVACVIGFIVPTLAERGLRPATSGARLAFLVLAWIALFAHATLDGIWLTEPMGSALVWAVILHRLPVGISIWWIVARTVGVRAAVMTIGVIVAGTLLGYCLGEATLKGEPMRVIGIFEGLLAGSLLHVVMHAHIPPPQGDRGRLHFASLLGMLLAVAALFLIKTHRQAGWLYPELVSWNLEEPNPGSKESP